MEGKYRLCPFCGKKINTELFPPVSNSSKYNINSSSVMCVNCICERISKNNLETIDKMCQFLDIPFDADR